MPHGETTRRSDLERDDLVRRLQARGMAQLQGTEALWIALDGSDLRHPQARAWNPCSWSSGCRGRG